jgi:nitrate/TMAO reductase-like tetraheme cytochrome c subunit
MENKVKKEKRFFKKVRGYKRFLLFFGINVFLLLVILTISAEITSRPAFCPTCHYMETFYQSWRTSAHNKVDCVECHFEPGISGTVRGKLNGLVQIVNYLSLSYKKRKPWADIPDNTCSRPGCHERQAFQDTTYDFKGIAFNHKHHLQELRRGKTLKCISCHSQIVQGTHIEITPQTCFNCHFKKSDDKEHLYDKLSNCTTCHNWKNKTKDEMAKYRYDHTNVVKNEIPCLSCHTNTIAGNGEVGKERCFQCHFEQSRLEKYSDISFIHTTHITKHSMKCFTCHAVIEHKIQKMDPSKPPDCVSCHSDAHSSQVSLFTGENGFGVEKSPSVMFLNGINCKGCHVFHNLDAKGIKTSTAGKGSCNQCHGSGYDKLITQWETATVKRLKMIKSIYSIVERQVKDSKNQNVNNASNFLDQANHNIKIVEIGKSVHNISFADKLLVGSYNLMTQALTAIDSKIKLPEFKSDAEFIPNECYNCHAGIQEINKNIYGLNFSHNMHIAKQRVPCDKCHSNAEKHGELILTKQNCNNCHHSQGKTDESCQKCHSFQATVYNGTLMNKNQPDFMKQANVGCVDCHIAGDQIVKPDNKICAKCHKPDYESQALDWKKDINGLTKEVEALLSSVKTSNLTDEQKTLVNETKKFISQLNTYPSIYVHNYDMLSTVLSDYKKKLKDIK